MREGKNSYKQILKATSLFGSVHVFSVLISIVKTKVITILIGANGFGILGLITSSLNLIVDITKIGLDTSAVKEISEKINNESEDKVSEFISVLDKIIWITGLIGGGLTILFSRWLSIKTFGTDTYTYAFIWLSIAVLLSQLTNGKRAILQGRHKLKKLAKANLLGSLLGVVVSLPLYYFYREGGIVPAIILSFFVAYLVNRFYSKETKKIAQFSFAELLKRSKNMLALGISMSVTSAMGALSVWFIQVYIRDNGGIEQVGFYAAGFLIINSYVGLIFNAMATDYFPRLSAVNKDNRFINEIVNKQAHIAILLLTPIITFFLALAPVLIEILYSSEFITILGLVTFGVTGTLFKAVSFSLGYVIIAKGDSKVFIKTSIFFNVIMVLVCLVSYNLGGLTGLGIGLFIYYLIHLIGISILTKIIYKVTLKARFYKIFLVCILLCLVSLLSSLLENILIKYILFIILIVISTLFSLREFGKYFNVKAEINRFMNRKKNAK